MFRKSLSAAGVGVAGYLVAALYTVDFVNPAFWIVSFLVSSVWYLSPYALFVLLAWRFRERYGPSLVVLVGTILASGLGIYALVNFSHPAAREDKVFLMVLPIAQLISAAVSDLIAIVATRFSSKSSAGREWHGG